MVVTETLEGAIDKTASYHYDVFADVLYLRLLSAEGLPTIGDLTDDGDILLRDEKSDQPVGLTIVSWWKRFGQGQSLPDSIREIQEKIEPLAMRVAGC